MNRGSGSCEELTVDRLSGAKESRYYSQPWLAYASPRRLVLIDDDPSFLAIMKRMADLEGISLECFDSLENIDVLTAFKNYDAAILDYDLGSRTAIDVSQYINCFAKELPTVIVSAKDRRLECRNSPRCVKSVLRKSAGYRYILDIAVRISQGELGLYH